MNEIGHRELKRGGMMRPGGTSGACGRGRKGTSSWKSRKAAEIVHPAKRRAEAQGALFPAVTAGNTSVEEIPRSEKSSSS